MMQTLVIDCKDGARKDSIANQLLNLLSDEEAQSFLRNLNEAGLEGVEARIDVDGSSRRLLLEKDGLSESELKGHSHEHHSRQEVESSLEAFDVSNEVKRNALGVYEILAQAEAQAHDSTPDDVCFHEVGNAFAIGYIVATCMLVEMLSPEKISATPITCGFGYVDCAHGRLPIPAPATANILQAHDIPHVAGDVEGELCTPTGAAIVARLVAIG